MLLKSGISIPTLSDSYSTLMCKEYKLNSESIFIGDSNDTVCLGQSHFNNAQKPLFWYFVNVMLRGEDNLSCFRAAKLWCFRDWGLNKDLKNRKAKRSILSRPGPHGAETAQAIRSVGLKSGVFLCVLHFACHLCRKKPLLLMVPPNSWHLFIITYVEHTHTQIYIRALHPKHMMSSASGIYLPLLGVGTQRVTVIAHNALGVSWTALNNSEEGLSA